MKLKALHITEENFRKYGKVVTAPSGQPTSEANDYKFWSDIASFMIEGETEIGICTVYRQENPEVATVERHLDTPEILIPIDGPFSLPLLLEGESENSMDAFAVDIGEVVVIDKGIWHGACLPVGQDRCSYFVIFKKNTPHNDVEKKPVAPVTIN